MSLLFLLSVALQVICLVHVVRTGRPYWWMLVLFLGSYIGVAVYFLTQILPDLRHDPRARRAARGVARKLDPTRDLRQLRDELARADTVQNRLRLGAEFLELGEAGEAEEVFRGCLRGLHADDPDILLALARAEFAQDKFEQCHASLSRLIETNPNFRSDDGHLLYARSLEALGRKDEAIAEYKVLDDSYPGEEARLRFAELLHGLGRVAEARELCQKTLERSRLAPKYYRRAQKEWIDRAQRLLAQ